MRAVWDAGCASASDDSDEVCCSKLRRGGRLNPEGERGCRGSGLSDVGARRRPWLLRGPVPGLGLEPLPRVGYGADMPAIGG
jgi:hypothetical protein